MRNFRFCTICKPQTSGHMESPTFSRCYYRDVEKVARSRTDLLSSNRPGEDTETCRFLEIVPVGRSPRQRDSRRVRDQSTGCSPLNDGILDSPSSGEARIPLFILSEPSRP